MIYLALVLMLAVVGLLLRFVWENGYHQGWIDRDDGFVHPGDRRKARAR